MKIAPSVLTANFKKLDEEIISINKAEYIHIDIMDGNFVPNISFGPFITKNISELAENKLDIHLMVSDPSFWIDEFSFKNTEYITVHYEAKDFLKAIDKVKKLNIKPGITIKPKTSVESIIPYLSDVKLVLVMSVEPGFGGQKFMPDMLEKVRELKKYREENNLDYVIEIDGGMNQDTLDLAKDAGVDIAVVGSYLFNQKDRNKVILSYK